MILFFLSLMLVCPLVALTLNSVLFSRPITAARYAGYAMGVSFLIGVGLLAYVSLSQQPILYLWINANTLSLLLCSLVLLVSFVVHRFSLRYMHGDRLYRRFFILLSLLTLNAQVMALADNLFLFWGTWSISNMILVLLMVHKKDWAASKNSGLLAFYTLAPGSICLFIAFIILMLTYSTNSIQALIQQSDVTHLSALYLSMSFILIAALTQSAIYPFHRWLISSLNSPTPVSALMHAGLVNGGGILLVKFAPLMILHQGLLTLLFLLGASSALLGTIWKLMQHDIKKMLACSTMAQMGFMMMQCGVGLFAAAIAHLCWHGLFKAYLFLSSGSTLMQTKSDSKTSDASLVVIMASVIGGVVAMSTFAFTTDKSFSLVDANAFVLFFAFIAGTQLMLTWVRSQQTFLSLATGLLLASFSGFMYGWSIHLIECLLPNISALPAYRLSLLHWGVMALFGALWVVFNLGLHQKLGQSRLGCWLYMNLFNASQPSVKTVTALRRDYNY